MSGSFWHGSVAPLAPGTKLLPASRRKGFQGKIVRRELEGLYDVDSVYFTSDREYARAWVARARGALLRVEPHGQVVADLDTSSGGFSAQSATVVEVQEYPVQMTLMEIRKAFAFVQPERYDADGFIVPHGDFLSDLVEMGLTREMCRKFGRWANPHRIMWLPKTNEFKYATDDVELQLAQHVRELMLEGTSYEQSVEVVTSDEAVAEIKKLVSERPNPWPSRGRPTKHKFVQRRPHAAHP